RYATPCANSASGKCWRFSSTSGMTPGLVVRQRTERFAAWLDANRNGLLVLSLVLLLLGGYLASRMSVRADLTSLLPQSKTSVRDLLALQKRARPFGTVNILLEA